DTITGDVPGIGLARGIRGTAARRKQGSNDEQTATQTECGPPTRAGTCSALRDWVGDGTSKCGADAPSAHVSWRLVRQVRSSSAWVEMDAVPVQPSRVHVSSAVIPRGSQKPMNPLSCVVRVPSSRTLPEPLSTMLTEISRLRSSPRHVVRLWNAHSCVVSTNGATDR